MRPDSLAGIGASFSRDFGVSGKGVRVAFLAGRASKRELSALARLVRAVAPGAAVENAAPRAAGARHGDVLIVVRTAGKRAASSAPVVIMPSGAAPRLPERFASAARIVAAAAAGDGAPIRADVAVPAPDWPRGAGSPPPPGVLAAALAAGGAALIMEFVREGWPELGPSDVAAIVREALIGVKQEAYRVVPEPLNVLIGLDWAAKLAYAKAAGASAAVTPGRKRLESPQRKIGAGDGNRTHV